MQRMGAPREASAMTGTLARYFGMRFLTAVVAVLHRHLRAGMRCSTTSR